MPPLVSVIIPTYNYAHFLREAIDSVIEQTFKDYEIIVVDDGSTDDTKEVIKQYSCNIHYIYKKNSGPNSSRNAGIKASCGKYIAFLDADDKWLSNKLALQIALIERNENIGLVYGTSIFFDNVSGAFIKKFPSVDVCCRGNILKELYLNQIISSPTPLIRRAVFEKIGIFDESRHYSDDWEMWLRIASEYEFDFTPEPLALYRVHNSISSFQTSNCSVRVSEFCNLFSSFAEKFPELKPLEKIRISTFKESMAWVLYQRGEIQQARVYLLQAVKETPLRMILYYRLLIKYLYNHTNIQKYQESENAYISGKYHLFTFNYIRARRLFLHAIKMNPFGQKFIYLGFFLTFTNKAVLNYVKKRKDIEYLDGSIEPSGNLSMTQW
jgi:glycosyltransferase involved in cell wall biosynthesis